MFLYKVNDFSLQKNKFGITNSFAYLYVSEKKLTMNKTILFCIAFVLSAVQLSAQNLYMSFKNGTQKTYAVSNIAKIQFSGNDMQIRLKNGSTDTWNVFDIGHYNYKGFTPIKAIEKFEQFTLYPNPSAKEFKIKLELNKAEKLQVQLIDMAGKTIWEQQQVIGAGLHTIDISTAFKQLPKGTYWCKVETPSKKQIEKIIKK